MQWSAKVFTLFGGKWGQALQLLSGVVGLVGVAYGLQTLMVERAQLPVCSAEVLAEMGEQNFLRQQKLTVEVAGAVARPGVWQVAVGARVAEAIEKAGGFSAQADRTFATQGLNLARYLEDGEKIYIPFAGEVGSKSSQPGEAIASESAPSGISINSASDKELQTLPGIGQARATAIIENRPYGSIDELVSKGAVGEIILNNIRAQIQL